MCKKSETNCATSDESANCRRVYYDSRNEQIVLKAKRKAIIESNQLTYRNIYSSFVEYNPKVSV